ncbi:MAG TPA: hypothetical protein VEF76_09525 [Patescibacteria group bacterium]|nr:hypothetical protein [Patescibacteria group bacterium]
MSDDPKQPAAQDAKKSRGLRRWIAGGVLTAVAAGAFVAVAPNFRNENAKPAPVAVTDAQAGDVVPVEDGLYPAVTSDRKLVRIYMDFGALEGGKPAKDTELDAALKAHATNVIMQTVLSIDSKDLPQSTGIIQEEVQKSLEELVVKLDVDKLGVLAKPGVDFTLPKITKITDARGQTVLFKKDNSAGNVLKALGL